MRALRVLMYHDSFEDYLVGLANGLAKHVELTVVHPDRVARLIAPCLDDTVQVVSLAMPRIRSARRLWAVPRLDRTARSMGADIVHVQQSRDPWFNLAQAGRARTVRVDTIHDVTPHLGDGMVVPAGDRTHRLSRRAIDRYITHAPVLRDDLARTWKVDPARIDVVAHGELASPYGGRAFDYDDRGPHRVLFFGRIWAYKGLDRLILAMNSLAKERPGLTLVIAGRGEPLDPYLALADPALTVDVRNRRVGDDETREVFSQATLACFPYVEASQSGALMMAYGFGVPAVATRVGGLPAVVRDEDDGLLVAPDDVPALAGAIARVLDEPGLRDKLAAGALERARTDLSWATIAGETVEVYARAIAGSKRRR